MQAAICVVFIDAQKCPTLINPCSCGWASNGSYYLRLNCFNQNLNDTMLGNILDRFLYSNDTMKFLGEMNLSSNLLTRIPKQIKYFLNLSEINLGVNRIESLSFTDFNFSNRFWYVRINLSNNRISKIDQVLEGRSPFIFHSQEKE